MSQIMGVFVPFECSIIVELFLLGICHFQPFFLFYNFSEHIFKHINGPLSGLFWRTEKCRSEDLRGGGFSTHQRNLGLKATQQENNYIRSGAKIFGRTLF